MLRRIHVPHLHAGKILLDADQAHHILHVLRLASGSTIELFDDAGHVAAGVLEVQNGQASAIVEAAGEPRPASLFQLTVASAVPKGDRADWMIQKLSELGVDRFVPLEAERSVVVPGGKNKLQRWQRLAVEAAKQSRRTGVMEIVSIAKPLERIADLAGMETSWYLSTRPDAKSIVQMLQQHRAQLQNHTAISPSPGTRGEGGGEGDFDHRNGLATKTNSPHASPLPDYRKSGPEQLTTTVSNPDQRIDRLTLLVGPEGGWTDSEIDGFQKLNVTPVSLTSTILRIETAAIAAAAIVASWPR